MEKEIDQFLNSLYHSPRTISAYRNALLQFLKVGGPNAKLDTDSYIQFLNFLQDKSPSTQRVYTTAVLKLYRFCRAGNWAELQEATQLYRHKSANKVVRFNRRAVEQVIAYCESLGVDSSSSLKTLENLRDRAFVLTLADTGLRISEACLLRCGDIDWELQRARLDQGSSKVAVRFSNRAIQALLEYLDARKHVEANPRTPYVAQPLFARHDIRASKRIRPITAGGMWKAIKGDPKKAIKGRIEEAGIDRSLVRIHDFRHHFVTTTYLARRDLKLSQELARHKTISTTNRYTHFGDEVDHAYEEIFNKSK